MKRAAIYVRQSVTRGRAEDSTSLAVQEEQCRAWCAANSHAVAGVFSDPDTSGSKVATADRPGWRAMLAAEFDSVVVYKFDRLARDEADSAVARGALAAAGKRLVSASEGEDPLTAGIHSVMAAHYSRQHAERTSLSRSKNLREGKAVGGVLPYGYKRVGEPRNYRYVQDPETIGVVKAITDRLRRGDSIHSVRVWLNNEGVPAPKGGEWNSWTAIRRLATHPFLFGGVPYNPRTGGQTRQRGDGLLRDEHGRVVINEDLAIMDRRAYDAMVALLDNNERPQATPRASRRNTSGLLSGYVYCACGGFDGDRKMWRGTVNARPGYTCPECRMSISHFEDVVVEEVLRGWGDTPRMHRVETAEAGGADEAASLREAIRHKQALQVDADDEEYDALADEVRALRKRLRAAEARKPVLRWTWEPTGQTYREAWDEAAGDEAAQRRVLDDVLARVTVRRGRPGRRTREQVLGRLMFDWKPDERWLAGA
ncbi:MAG: recombinase family protein [Marmoricola sp.]